MRQSKANQWLHVFLPIFRDTLRIMADAPSRSVADLSKRLGVEEVLEAEGARGDTSETAAAPAAPFCPEGTERPIPRPTDATEHRRDGAENV